MIVVLVLAVVTLIFLWRRSYVIRFNVKHVAQGDLTTQPGSMIPRRLSRAIGTVLASPLCWLPLAMVPAVICGAIAFWICFPLVFPLARLTPTTSPACTTTHAGCSVSPAATGGQ